MKVLAYTSSHSNDRRSILASSNRCLNLHLVENYGRTGVLTTPKFWFQIQVELKVSLETSFNHTPVLQLLFPYALAPDLKTKQAFCRERTLTCRLAMGKVVSSAIIHV